MSININEVLKARAIDNFNYYSKRYNVKLTTMYHKTLTDTDNMIGGLSRAVSREDRWLLTKIFESCNADYRGVPEVLVLQYREYFPDKIVKLCEERLAEWQIDYKQYLL